MQTLAADVASPPPPCDEKFLDCLDQHFRLLILILGGDPGMLGSDPNLAMERAAAYYAAFGVPEDLTPFEALQLLSIIGELDAMLVKPPACIDGGTAASFRDALSRMASEVL